MRAGASLSKQVKTRQLSTSNQGIIPLIAAVAVLLIMVGALIIVLIGGSVQISFSLP